MSILLAGSKNRICLAVEFGCRCDVADSAMQPLIVVMVNKISPQVWINPPKSDAEEPKLQG